ncbi:hypothetical protein J2S07_001070 [Robertmurraya andreesenii]|uniref:Uncharacterized protein n=1 Tax=Anoxybacillus andreesenii TaxID=1325932 RepID=A0ABT9V1E0_9BACL|nr:hypothetical protein [Robertmurraya andreesenii]
MHFLKNGIFRTKGGYIFFKIGLMDEKKGYLSEEIV